MNDLPGCEKTYGRKPPAPCAKTERKLRLIPIDRTQMRLVPVDVERLIPDDHEARAIWEFIGSLDLSAYYDRIDSIEGSAGSPSFDPRLLISLWIYSYSKGISSAREIARLCAYDPAYQWLTGMCPINYHTLADFRSTHKDSLRSLFIEVLALLTHEGLVTLERVMHDGTKIKACAGKDTFRREETIEKYLVQAEEQVRALEVLEEEITPRLKKAKERAACERKKRLSHALEELQTIKSQKRSAADRVSITDPDCRNMKNADGGYGPSYNAQLSTDAKEKAIIACSVAQSPADQTLLTSALTELEKTIRRLPDQLVVDAGFTTRDAILTAHEKGVDLIGSFPHSASGRSTTLRRQGISETFFPERFRYDSETNTYLCPEGKVLTFKGTSAKRGKTENYYQAKECKNCVNKTSCCPKATQGRSINRLENDPLVTTFLEKMKTPEAHAVYKQRSEVAEFPNAWIKDKFGLRQFRLRGLVKVGIELLWACLTYNIKLWIRLRGKEKPTNALATS
jgi:transposase